MLTHEQAALNRAWPMICQMVTALALGIAFFVPGKQAHLRLWRLARVAESLARRWLVLAACEAGEWPQVHVADDCDTDPAKAKSIIAQTHKIPGFNQDHGGEANGAARPSDFTRSSFRLAEAERPYPSAQPRLRTYPPGTGPRLTWLDMPREPDPEPVEANPDNLTQLQRRCAALVSLVSDRERHVQRMARWLATTAARNAAQGWGKHYPMRTWLPPGASFRQRRKDPERQNMLLHLNDLARDAVLNRTPPRHAP